MPTELHSHSLSVNNNNKDQPNDDSTPPMMTTTDSSNKSSTSVLTDDQLLKLLLNHQKDYGALGANLFLVMIVFGVIFCWERGLKTYITITLVEFILQVILGFPLMKKVTTLRCFEMITLCRLPITMLVQVLMFYFYGPFLPFHIFSIFRILFTSASCFHNNRLFFVMTFGIVGSTLGGMYLAFQKERHLLTSLEETNFYYKLIEIFTTQYTIVVASFLFCQFFKKKYEEKHETQIEISREKSINSEKTQFIANLSHEARNSLQGIMATVEVLKHKVHGGVCHNSCEHCFKKDSSISELIGDVQSSASILLHVLSSSLQMSSLEMGIIKLKNEEFNTLSLFESMAGVFSLEAQRKNLSLNSFFNAAKVPLYLKGDSVRLSQIMMNIISNAIKYTSQGLVRVNCTIATPKELTENFMEINKEKTYVKLECIDTGRGISKEELEKLFHPYHWIDPDADVTHSFDHYYKTSSRRASATHEASSLINTNRNGLGLKITKMLVEKMNGKISIDSAESKGTTVTVILPLDTVKETEKKIHDEWLNEAHISKVLNEDAPSVLLNVIIIDENQCFRDSLKSYLSLFKRVRNISEFDSCENFLNQTHSLIQGDTTLLFCRESDYEIISERLKEHRNKVKMVATIVRGTTRIFTDNMYLSKPIQFGNLIEILDETTSVAEQNNILSERRNSLPDFSLKSVLLADDNALNRKILVNMLKIIGFKDIDTANDGLECFNKFKSKEYSLVLLDCFMPIMTGGEACEMIRNFEKQRDNDGKERIPIVAITANTWETKEQLLSQGFDDAMYKPITLVDLKHHIMEVIK
ncbi:hypothetical protein FDP41_012783 [Naegleria fowleri]|uniref:Histidine kinase n=1 Tax=Naegleria fowleri TaxID=5763 RepID=A0A6A5C695_NAEFO|nr:uncharacterized protein FDP41_012783 [Naegleria fowleri]KAF0980995.1 hypothetical protein FDP41_012783 [Naegleria fowleri]